MLISILLSGLVIFITHTMEAVTGFGCAVLAMPFITALLGLRRGVMVITILGWFLALYLAITKRKMINFRQFAIICGTMVLGLPIGMYLFRTFDVSVLKKIFAVFIVFSSLWQLVNRIAIRNVKEITPPKGKGALPYYGILFAGGIIHGMFSTGGPLAVIYAARALPDKGQFRATLCLLWSTLNTIIIVSYLIEGTITPQAAGTTGSLILFVLAGIIAGEKIHNKLNEKIFSVMVFSMLLVTGIFMFFL
jgi:uncharacterized membrane protein YfcA